MGYLPILITNIGFSNTFFAKNTVFSNTRKHVYARSKYIKKDARIGAPNIYLISLECVFDFFVKCFDAIIGIDRIITVSERDWNVDDF